MLFSTRASSMGWVYIARCGVDDEVLGLVYAPNDNGKHEVVDRQVRWVKCKPELALTSGARYASIGLVSVSKTES